VRSASVFGEAIIGIVYLPILALTGIEGKLFRPMATTVLLALLGAFILSLTFVPVLASYMVRPGKVEHETWFLAKARRLYVPVLGHALKRSWIPVSAAIISLALALGVFTRIGAEFVPLLDEGDILIEARRLPGVALTESVATDLRVERAILSIPEVAHVVGKIGSPELANDPMGIEASDVYVDLKPRETWRPGYTKEMVAAELSAAIEKSVPEVAGSVSQPIQMRTNELIAGVRSDVAVLLYGPDMALLQSMGEKAAESIRRIPGAEDVRIEQVAGLSYLRVIPDRAKLARYGLTIADINQLTETMAVGHKAGNVLEGERRFSMVVKTNHGYAGELDVLQALPLRSLSKQLVPLGDVAELKFVTGPAEVNREGQSRRLIVEFNVRGRDMSSVVKDAKKSVSSSLTPPTGYRVEWGGQFQHYEEARERLSVVVPLALLLILFLLWLAFQSIKTALLIFLGVPFAIVGGIFALWIRDIPFSISAGVGFIALFGVAVLNGLVLVSFAQHLEAEGQDPSAAIRHAAELRLRPVLMTAFVASLGFLPMAISTAPGAEVQRPLATVVIGGLITATLLTMLALPVVYARLGRNRRGKNEEPST
jgi:cobalt-zinc-cadmium resistance protein CzcA